MEWGNTDKCDRTLGGNRHLLVFPQLWRQTSIWRLVWRYPCLAWQILQDPLPLLLTPHRVHWSKLWRAIFHWRYVSVRYVSARYVIWRNRIYYHPLNCRISVILGFDITMRVNNNSWTIWRHVLTFNVQLQHVSGISINDALDINLVVHHIDYFQNFIWAVPLK